MKAIAHRTATTAYAHRIDIRQHHLVADEPTDQGGNDSGPTPQELLAASLASCTAITIEMYADRKGWDLGPVEVQVEYEQPDRSSPTRFKLTLRFPDELSPEQAKRLSEIAAKCPVHRTLAGEVTFEQSVERIEAATA
jgi:putative redox protein